MQRIIIALLTTVTAWGATMSSTAIPRIPVLPAADDWWQLTTMPDLGELNGPKPERQHIVDHGFIQRDDGSWLLWACLRGTAVSRLIYGWEADALTEAGWSELGVTVRADGAWHEQAKPGNETAGAPFFIRHGDAIRCYYHSGGVRMMTSTDGRHFTRVDLGGGSNKPGIPGGRDVMIMEHDGRYYSYATVTDYRPGAEHTRENLTSWVVAAVSDDMDHWEGRHIVSSGGEAGHGPVDSESPFVVFIDGYFYLFRSSSISFKTYVYRSTDPLDFGRDDDSKLVASFPLKAPELVLHDGQWYISDLHDFQGLRMGRLSWPVDER